MVKTGYIAFITETGGGQDANGNPTASTSVVSADVPCNLAVITKDYKLVEEGQLIVAKYKIVIDVVLINKLNPVVSIFSIKKVQVKDGNGNSLGVFQIRSIEPLKLMNQIKIVI